MTKYREILRLKHPGFSERNIARTAGVSRNTVKRVVETATAAKIDWTRPILFLHYSKILCFWL